MSRRTFHPDIMATHIKPVAFHFWWYPDQTQRYKQTYLLSLIDSVLLSRRLLFGLASFIKCFDPQTTRVV